jgi:hypothetical protein
MQFNFEDKEKCLERVCEVRNYFYLGHILQHTRVDWNLKLTLWAQSNNLRIILK